MSAARWAYRLHPDCAPQPPRGQGAAWAALRAGFVTDAALARVGGPPSALLLLQLHRAGLLQRELRWGAQAWARLHPQRTPAAAPPAPLPRGRLQLLRQVLVHASEEGLTLEAPGSWARINLVRPELLVLLDALARGCSPARAQRLLPQAPGIVQPLLETLAWCGLLARPDAPAWAAHDLLFHSRTRRGFGREAVGRLSAPQQLLPLPEGPRLVLARGCPADLPGSLAQTLAARRSLREQAGDAALSLADLGRLLWHTLAVQTLAGRTRRPYPGGGRCYALLPFLVVSRCAGLEAGLYAYDASLHELIHMPDHSAARQSLMQEATGSAQTRNPPQVLLVLCADYARMRSAYGDLGYSLLLKEVGAVMQTAQMVATALNLACCPLGTGDARLFAGLSGTEALQWPAVGELMLGSPA